MDYYYHGTNQVHSKGLDIMIDIIESGGIKSNNKRSGSSFGIYNGDDYISVGKWNRDENIDFDKIGESCFYGWIFWCPAFIIDSNIDAIHAEKHDEPVDPSKGRYSCFIDEYHVRDEIGLDKIRGIALPFSLISGNKDYLLKTLKILQYAKLYGWDVYESDSSLIDRVDKQEVYDDMSYSKKGTNS